MVEIPEGEHRHLDLLLKKREGLAGERDRLLATTTKLRSGALTTAVVLVLALFVLDQFLFLNRKARLVLVATPVVLLAAAGSLDLGYYRRRLLARDDHLDALDQELAQRGGHLLGSGERGDRRQELETVLVVGYYLLPALVLGALLLWQAL